MKGGFRMPTTTILAAASGTGLFTADMQQAFSTAFNAIKTDVTGVVVTALPVGLGIMGLFLAVRLGISFFRSIAR